MLGRNRRGGCGLGCCYHCARGNETREFKRAEARQVTAEIAQEVADMDYERELARVRERLRPVLNGLPAQHDDPGVMEELTAEMEKWAPSRRAATTLLLGEDDWL